MIYMLSESGVLSVEEEVSCGIKLDVWDDACDELQEDEESEVRLDLVSRFDHSV